MLAPTLATCWRRSFYRFLFRRVLRTFPSSPAQTAERFHSLGGTAQPGLLLAVVFWLPKFSPLPALWCGSRHDAHIPPGLLRLPDVKAINVKLLIFLSGLCHQWNVKSCVADRLFFLLFLFFLNILPAYAAGFC
ncbi:MAG: hypothetical protein ACLT5P_08225 [Flavonifractor plautii]